MRLLYLALTDPSLHMLVFAAALICLMGPHPWGAL